MRTRRIARRCKWQSSGFLSIISSCCSLSLSLAARGSCALESFLLIKFFFLFFSSPNANVFLPTFKIQVQVLLSTKTKAPPQKVFTQQRNISKMRTRFKIQISRRFRKKLRCKAPHKSSMGNSNTSAAFPPPIEEDVDTTNVTSSQTKAADKGESVLHLPTSQNPVSRRFQKIQKFLGNSRSSPSPPPATGNDDKTRFDYY